MEKNNENKIGLPLLKMHLFTIKPVGFVHCSWLLTFVEFCVDGGALELNKVVKRKQKAFTFWVNHIHLEWQFFLIYEGWFHAIS